ncbi:ketoacyl-ACP synthase III [Flavihumibacter rivuli]|uniref:3-oxoacyl-ACP synthase III family protein n=1 Tax=Flavihumibacter rivuli TaxID=2838156 RepID=UPI001BDE7CF2|nr:ketoacyl-ACP synthase III [Flavihumibacter rivuli]ULQ57181.1 ketoacyl-ACP synthase III [Flavihumibacter rivuli]
MQRSVITGTGKFIPNHIKKNEDFGQSQFFTEDNQPIETPAAEVVRKFKNITGIEERRYADPTMKASHMGAEAAKKAIEESGINPEELDLIIAAHNYGDVDPLSRQSDTVPALAARIKHMLGIRNPNCVAYDILFGCPGWVQGLIIADTYFKAGTAKKALIIGTETLSRVIDNHDRDSMIFADGAGATVVESREGPATGEGILSTSVQSHCLSELDFINFGPSYYPGSDPHHCFIKMKGRKVYEYALSHVPAAMKDCLDKSGAGIEELKMIFIHQANEKMDEAIIKAFYKLYGHQPVPEKIMPMSIQWLGNSSVATVPTLYDLVKKHEVPGYQLQKGDLVMFASVGAGMNINAVCYRY